VEISQSSSRENGDGGGSLRECDERKPDVTAQVGLEIFAATLKSPPNGSSGQPTAS
jgi:hypothetical protein